MQFCHHFKNIFQIFLHSIYALFCGPLMTSHCKRCDLKWLLGKVKNYIFYKKTIRQRQKCVLLSVNDVACGDSPDPAAAAVGFHQFSVKKTKLVVFVSKDSLGLEIHITNLLIWSFWWKLSQQVPFGLSAGQFISSLQHLCYFILSIKSRAVDRSTI